MEPSFPELLDRYLSGELSESDYALFREKLNTQEGMDQLRIIIDSDFRGDIIQGLSGPGQAETVYKFVSTKIQKGRIIRLSGFRKWIAAASVLILVGLGTYFILNRPHQKMDISNIPAIHDVAAPNNTHARLTLASGKTIFLDSTRNGKILSQSGTEVTKNWNNLAYQKTAGSTEPAYNLLEVPRGSDIVHLMLADGTKVILNAASSIRYPVSFTGKDRTIEMMGEAYFEVAHDAAHPFIVKNKEVQVQVLGTHFNVNSYSDEPSIRITLLEGSVNVTTKQGSKRLTPNEQAVINENKISVDKNIDTEEIMSWIYGRFNFGEKTDLREIMRQIGRWYDVDILYQDNLDQSFGGSVSRQVSVSKVLEKLALTDRVKFKIENKKITVMKP